MFVRGRMLSRGVPTPHAGRPTVTQFENGCKKIKHMELVLHRTTRLECRDPDIYATLRDARGIVISYNDVERIERATEMSINPLI